MIRGFDIFFSITGLIILSPILLTILIVNLLVTRGRPFFVQCRVGHHGALFNVVKFRSMLDKPHVQSEITIGERDVRITWFGYYLRRYKLDEFPQFINVLKGEMSLVGPRPEVPKFVNLYSDKQKEILKVKPGITDYASIEYFDEDIILSKVDDPERFYIEVLLPLKIALNQKYIENQSLQQYFLILWSTIQSVLFRTKKSISDRNLKHIDLIMNKGLVDSSTQIGSAGDKK